MLPGPRLAPAGYRAGAKPQAALRQVFQKASAIAELPGAGAHAVEHGEPEVVERCLAADWPMGFDSSLDCESFFRVGTGSAKWEHD